MLYSNIILVPFFWSSLLRKIGDCIWQQHNNSEEPQHSVLLSVIPSSGALSACPQSMERTNTTSWDPRSSFKFPRTTFKKLLRASVRPHEKRLSKGVDILVIHELNTLSSTISREPTTTKIRERMLQFFLDSNFLDDNNLLNEWMFTGKINNPSKNRAYWLIIRE